MQEIKAAIKPSGKYDQKEQERMASAWHIELQDQNSTETKAENQNQARGKIHYTVPKEKRQF
jgi:hypothetical protein